MQLKLINRTTFVVLLPGKHCCIVRINLYNLVGASSVLNKAYTMIFNDIMRDIMAKYFYNVSPDPCGIGARLLFSMVNMRRWTWRSGDSWITEKKILFNSLFLNFYGFHALHNISVHVYTDSWAQYGKAW